MSLSHGATFIFLLARKKVWMVVRIVIDKLILFEDLRFRSVEILSKKKTFKPFGAALSRMVISMVYYGFLLYVTRLAGSPYLNLFLMYLSDVPTHLINWVIVQK